MEKIILNLIYDDYYSLWEVYDETRKCAPGNNIEDVIQIVVDLVERDIVICSETSALSREDARNLTKEKAVVLIKNRDNWLVPKPEGTIVQVTSEAGPIEK